MVGCQFWTIRHKPKACISLLGLWICHTLHHQFGLKLEHSSGVAVHQSQHTTHKPFNILILDVLWLPPSYGQFDVIISTILSMQMMSLLHHFCLHHSAQWTCKTFVCIWYCIYTITGVQEQWLSLFGEPINVDHQCPQYYQDVLHHHQWHWYFFNMCHLWSIIWPLLACDLYQSLGPVEHIAVLWDNGIITNHTHEYFHTTPGKWYSCLMCHNWHKASFPLILIDGHWHTILYPSWATHWWGIQTLPVAPCSQPMHQPWCHCCCHQ